MSNLLGHSIISFLFIHCRGSSRSIIFFSPSVSPLLEEEKFSFPFLLHSLSFYFDGLHFLSFYFDVLSFRLGGLLDFQHCYRGGGGFKWT